MKIIPTVLAYDKASFMELYERLLGVTDTIQIDFMDGAFVETESIGLDDLPELPRDKTFEAHLMVERPMEWVPGLIERGFSRIIVHYETLDDPHAAAEQIGVEKMLALNPETSIEEIVPYAQYYDGVLFLGVHPGRNAAPYVEETPARIRAFKERCPDALVQVDGGMKPATVPGVVRAGAERLNTGSYVGQADDPREALEKMYEVADER